MPLPATPASASSCSGAMRYERAPPHHRADLGHRVAAGSDSPATEFLSSRQVFFVSWIRSTPMHSRRHFVVRLNQPLPKSPPAQPPLFGETTRGASPSEIAIHLPAVQISARRQCTRRAHQSARHVRFSGRESRGLLSSQHSCWVGEDSYVSMVIEGETLGHRTRSPLITRHGDRKMTAPGVDPGGRWCVRSTA